MKLALEDDEPTAISKVEFGMLFLALVLGAGSFSCHLTAADLGTQALDRSGYETWCFLLGMAAGAAFLAFGGLAGTRLLTGKKSKRKRRHRRGSHQHRSHRDHGDGSPVAHDGKSRNDTEDGSADADGSGGDGGD